MTAHVAAWLRQAANEAAEGMGLDQEFVETFVCGHGTDDLAKSRRLSYLPLPSIGHLHIDGRVRRAFFVEPPGSPDPRARAVAHALPGASVFDGAGRWKADLRAVGDPSTQAVFSGYLSIAATWGSVTPVVLPGHDDRRAQKTLRLVLKSLAQASCTTPVTEIHLQRLPVFPGAERADRYFVPEYMRASPLTHVTITFAEPVRGPLAIGRGRHVGLGVLAPLSGRP